MSFKVVGNVLEMDGIVRDAEICSGAPRVAGCSIPVGVLAGRFWAGESVKEISKDYAVTVSQVETAIRFELIRSGKRLSWKSQYAMRAAPKPEADGGGK